MEESHVMWAGEVEKRSGWQGFRFWRPRILTITYHSVLVSKPTARKAQKLILRRHIVDIHASDLAANPLAFTLIILSHGPLYFRASSFPDRDAIVLFLKPDPSHKDPISLPQVQSLESFVRENVGNRVLLLQRMVLRKYSRMIYSGFVGIRDWEPRRSQSMETAPTSAGGGSCLKTS